VHYRAFKETFKLFELCTLFKEKISRSRTRRKEGEGEMRGEEICRFVEIVLMVTYFCRNTGFTERILKKG